MGWTGKVRGSLARMDDEDGRFIEQQLLSQERDQRVYHVDETKYRRLVTNRVRRHDKLVSVTVPERDAQEEEDGGQGIRESQHVQAQVAAIGEAMGFTIWLPKNDRTAIRHEWTPEKGVLLDVLPLNYGEVTLRTIEQIDVIWLQRRAIVSAFEVEHTTSIYSGILRMADLLALQPNMDIKLHIVAPTSRREKVFQEIQRPVFSLLERAPLSECCTFISYHSLEALSQQKHLTHLSDTVLDEYAEEAE